jgi:hypothetical protein
MLAPVVDLGPRWLVFYERGGVNAGRDETWCGVSVWDEELFIIVESIVLES